jgi:hypothetical protein
VPFCTKARLLPRSSQLSDLVGQLGKFGVTGWTSTSALCILCLTDMKSLNYVYLLGGEEVVILFPLRSFTNGKSKSCAPQYFQRKLEAYIRDHLDGIHFPCLTPELSLSLCSLNMDIYPSFSCCSNCSVGNDTSGAGGRSVSIRWPNSRPYHEHIETIEI